jgi:hypothetical protein
MTTLTLQLDDDLMARVRHLAAARQTTVAEMIHRFLKVATESPLQPADLPPLTRQALGMFPAMSDDEVRRVLDEERTLKHGNG